MSRLRFHPTPFDPPAPRRSLVNAAAREELIADGKVAAWLIAAAGLVATGLALGVHFEDVRFKLLLAVNALVDWGVL